MKNTILALPSTPLRHSQSSGSLHHPFQISWRFISHISPPVARNYERPPRETHFLGMFGIAVSFDSGHDTRAWLIGLRHVILGVQEGAFRGLCYMVSEILCQA
ncbi:hypothetical protein CEXT_505561 [Caerostris extrusa]|uniref:Uncharacterized protein n=1 Tax=Caerostris extrusa TaxID=172846 RepID=A0AAV4NH75_CAEEX|nr:hypothetical protein CEXT_505561 [Caerostris extrusa]